MKKLPLSLLLSWLPSLAMAAPVIAPGSLDQVLRAWSLAVGALLSADGRLTRGVDSPGLAELSSPERDLARMLAGTGLEAVRQPDGSYLLRAAAVAPTSAALAPPATEAELQALTRLPEVVARAQAESPLDTVSRFAVKGGAALRDTPQALTIVEADQIRDRGLLSMDELLAYVPGVQPSLGEGNRDNAVFRGYNTSADFYLNGMRDDIQYFRDFYNIEAVEVLKGPNAMALGRGGSGGAVNRVGKQAQWRQIGDADLLLGSWRKRRASVDVGAAFDPQWAWRLNAVDEDSGSFRHGAWLRRYGVSPALAWRDGTTTLVQASLEHFRDRRSTDRGVPSLGARPVDSDPSTFFGDPDHSHNGVDIDSLTLRVEHQVSPALRFSSQLHYAVYDKYYQNVFPGGMEDSTHVRMLGYGTRTHRSNLFYTAGLDATVETGALRHRLSAGLELGRQRADNARTTGYFDTLGTDVRFVTVPLAQPTFDLPVSFRASPTDMANASKAGNAALYLQDQVTLSPRWQVVAGLRAETLDVDLRDLRSDLQLSSHDRPLSPRLGVIYRPLEQLSLYASYSQSYALRVGEQMASLTTTNQDLAPEVVRNREIGARWDDGERLSGSLAVYQLRRANVLVVDAVNAGENRLAEGQRGLGLELELAGRVSSGWKLSAGYAWQRSRLTATQSATLVAGAQMPYVPRQSLSLWSRHTLTPQLEVSFGVIARSSMFSSTSNLVQLPGYARLDASLYYQVTPGQRVQLSVENLFDRRYYASSYNDNNISPGSPRALRIALHRRF
ncbi:TonB-dependent siderophore receptor [Duganella sp. PWIR1]